MLFDSFIYADNCFMTSYAQIPIAGYYSETVLYMEANQYNQAFSRLI